MRLLTMMLMALLPLQVLAQVNSIPSQPHLLVKGHAERMVQPDRFTVSVNIGRVDAEPEQARKLAQADAAAVLQAFKDNHALKDSIDAAALTIGPESAYDEAQRKAVFKGTRVSRRLSADFGKLEDVRGFLARIKTSEHLQITGIRPFYSDWRRLRAELKREAALQSRASAEGLAGVYGSRIIGLYTISDVAPDFAYGVHAGTWPNGKADGGSVQDSPTPVLPSPAYPAVVEVSGSMAAAEALEAGSITISENVYAIYLIAQ